MVKKACSSLSQASGEQRNPFFHDPGWQFSDDYFREDNTACHKARILSSCLLEHDSDLILLQGHTQ